MELSAGRLLGALSRRVVVGVKRCSQRLISRTSVADYTGLVLHGVSSFCCFCGLRYRLAYLFRAVAQPVVSFVELPGSEIRCLFKRTEFSYLSFIQATTAADKRRSYVDVDIGRAVCRLK